MPFEDVKRFTMKMKDIGNDCELFKFEGEEHGFIKHRKSEILRYEINISIRKRNVPHCPKTQKEEINISIRKGN